MNIAAIVCLILGLVFEFIFVGYGMTALIFFFAALCLFIFSVLRRRKTRWARRLRIALIIALLLGFGCFMAAELPVLSGAHGDADAAADWLIVMGAGVNGDEPSLSLQNRLEKAQSWLLEHPNGVAILSGGQGDGENLSEADCMYAWLLARGVAPERLIREDQATSSYENIAFSLALLQAHGGDPAGPVAIVSNEYHLCRIRLIATQLGAQPVCVAARTPYPILFLNYAVREAFALWQIWIFGMT